MGCLPPFPPSLAEENLRKLSAEKCGLTFMCTFRFANPNTGNNAFE